MKKLLLVSCFLSLVSSPLVAVKLCAKDRCYVINTWKNASGSIGDYTYTSGLNGTWNLSVTTSPTGTVAGENGCFESNTSPTGSGQNCWCRVRSVNGISCGGSWVFDSTRSGDCSYNCTYACGGCAKTVSYISCTRSALFNVGSNFPNESSVTCPLSGTCTNTNYKTVGDSDSCGSGWAETTSPALTISGTYSDGKGSFTYSGCAAN